MREILFRGKRLDNGEWVYGSFCMDAVEQKNGLCGVDGFIRRYDFAKGKMQMHEVDRESVSQFTGLTDKNGKRIFDGDILHIVSYTCDYDFKTSVGAKYGYTSGLYVDGDFNGGDFTEIGFAFDYWSNEDAEVEVIGNIYDTPALMPDGD